MNDSGAVPKTRRRYTRYPWTTLAVGDSFVIGGDFEHGHSLSVAAALYAKKHPEYRFSVRKTSEGFRCTRVARRAA